MISSTTATNILPPNPAWVPANRDNQQVTDGLTHNHRRHDRVQENGEAQGISGQGYHRHADKMDNANTQVTDANQTVGASLAYQSVATALNSSFAMQVTTKEGDVVTIGFSDSATHKQSAVQLQDATTQAMGYQEETTQNSSFNISVQGNLSDAEKKSLSDLMQQMQQVGSSFFQGQTQNAFQQAQNVGFDAGQIAGFSMSMNLELSVQAVSAYQQTGDQSGVDMGGLKQMAGFFKQALDNLSVAPQALQPFANPQGVFADLSAGVTEAVASQTPSSSDKPQQLDMLQQLMQMVGTLLFDAPNNPEQQSTTTTDPAPTAVTTPAPVVASDLVPVTDPTAAAAVVNQNSKAV